MTVYYRFCIYFNIDLARRILHKPIEILVGDKGQTASRNEQYIEVWSNYREKFLRLLQLLGEWNEHGSIIIFVSRQNEADELFAELLKVSGFIVFTLFNSNFYSMDIQASFYTGDKIKQIVISPYRISKKNQNPFLLRHLLQPEV